MQAQTQTKGVQHSESTLFLCSDDEHEYKIAVGYVKEKYPGSLASVVREIPVDRLQSVHVIVPLFRPRGCTDAMVTKDEGRREIVRPTPLKDMIPEVVEAKPLHVKDYWTVLSGAGQGVAFASVAGAVSVNKLFGALSERLEDPITIKGWRADVRHLKIGS
jgi:hypothetical protein